MLTYKEIKERVEHKISNELDAEQFARFANEALSELNMIAHVEAPAIYYKDEMILRENPEYKFTAKFLNKHEGKIYLPFFYNVGSNNLTIDIEFKEEAIRGEWKDKFTKKEKLSFKEFDVNKNFIYEEVGVNGKKSNILKFTNTDVLLDNDLIIVKMQVFKKIKDKRIREVIIKLPEDFQHMVKLDAVATNLEGTIASDVYRLENGDKVLSSSPVQTNVYVDFNCVGDNCAVSTFPIRAVALNSFSYDNMTYESNNEFVYYIKGEYVHIISYGREIKEISMHYTRRMTEVDPDIDFDEQDVEFDVNYANIIVFSIAHKILENNVGTEDAETATMFQKYDYLRNEYINKVVPVKLKRRQKALNLKH